MEIFWIYWFFILVLCVWVRLNIFNNFYFVLFWYFFLFILLLVGFLGNFELWDGVYIWRVKFIVWLMRRLGLCRFFFELKMILFLYGWKFLLGCNVLYLIIFFILVYLFWWLVRILRKVLYLLFGWLMINIIFFDLIIFEKFLRRYCFFLWRLGLFFLGVGIFGC